VSRVVVTHMAFNFSISSGVGKAFFGEPHRKDMAVVRVKVGRSKEKLRRTQGVCTAKVAQENVLLRWKKKGVRLFAHYLHKKKLFSLGAPGS
jgi:hypothetical protein